MLVSVRIHTVFVYSFSFSHMITVYLCVTKTKSHTFYPLIQSAQSFFVAVFFFGRHWFFSMFHFIKVNVSPIEMSIVKIRCSFWRINSVLLFLHVRNTHMHSYPVHIAQVVMIQQKYHVCSAVLNKSFVFFCLFELRVMFAILWRTNTRSMHATSK